MMERESWQVLEEGLERFGIMERELYRGLETFIRELERWNPRFGFVRASGKEIVVKHVLDSLAGVSHFRMLDPPRVADLGSGAGFPGIPLALALPHIRFTLIEPSRKRAAFLKSVQSLLKATNLRILETDLAFLGRHLEKAERFPCLTFRAFRPLTRKGLNQMLDILQDRGSIVAYKGKREQTEQEACIAEQVGLHAQIVPLTVPFLEEERNLLWLSR
ncbi:MAG: 16S rRNA (guanine(527)-N(7))-methyltransferase RsmG [Spirochaetales bacterium]